MTYKCHDFLETSIKYNRIPAFVIKIEFATGALEGCQYNCGGINNLWKLIGASITLDDEIFFEISRRDMDIKFQGYGVKKKFCLFQDTYDYNLNILGSPVINKNKLDLIEAIDHRWDLPYQLPGAAFYDFMEMTGIGTQVLQSGSIGDHVVFSQSLTDLGLPLGT